MIEVFKTNVQNREEAKALIERLIHYFPDSRINLDLEDCDKVLRIQLDAGAIDILRIKHVGRALGFHIDDLE